MDPTSLTDFLAVLDLLDHVRQGYFDMIHIVPSASAWSRSRHSGLPGQPPLRSRFSPLGLSLSPVESEKIHSANRVLEIAAWVAEQTLQYPSKMIGLILIFPEDLGGQISNGPSSLCVLREFQLLEGTCDVRRAAGLCQFTRVEYKRPIGVLSNSIQLRNRLSLGWPSLQKFETDLCTTVLFSFVAPAAMSTRLLLGFQKTTLFVHLLRFGLVLISGIPVATLERRFVSLRAGDQSDLTPLGASPLLSVACFMSFVFALRL